MVWLVLVLAFFLAGLRAETAPARLVLISAHWEGIQYETEHGFREWHRKKFGQDVEFQWRDVGGGSDSLKFIESEFKQTPGGIGIDLFFGGGYDPYIRLKEKGLLATHHPSEEILARIPADINGLPLYDPDHQWFGTALSGFGILYNKRVIAIRHLQAVSSWEDLCDPALLSWVGSGDPRASGSSQAMYEIILQAYGWEKGWKIITEMAGNIRSFNKNSSMANKDVTVGETAYALSVDVQGLMQVSVGGPENMGYVYPKGATIINPDSLAILKGAPNATIAGRFMDFMLSPDGQRLWVKSRGQPGGPVRFDIPRMTILPELYPEYPADTKFINPFEVKVAFRYDTGLAKSRRVVVQNLVGTTVIDLHAEVVRAWKSINRPGRSPEERERLIGEFSRPLLTADQAVALAEGDWKDPKKRNRILLDWQVQAVEKYRKF
ncbi:MAG: extracellular solute-binding protein [Verrucomicrobiae bacterium]|nr:extracellular solute-binding protein [Verrucomicrobiae bacterium]